jgi:hypothetical protein
MYERFLEHDTEQFLFLFFNSVVPKLVSLNRIGIRNIMLVN